MILFLIIDHLPLLNSIDFKIGTGNWIIYLDLFVYANI